VRSVPSGHVDALWHLVGPQLQKAVDRFDDLSLDALRADIIDRQKQLYVYADEKMNIEWAMVTEIKINPKGRKIVVVALGGQNFLDSHLAEVVDFLRKWGEEIGASVEIPGREGWKRALKPFGGRVKYIVMEV